MFLDPDKVILKNMADAIDPNSFEIPASSIEFYESILYSKLLIISILIKFLVLIQYVQNSNFAFALPLKV